MGTGLIVFFVVLGSLVVLPILAYMMVKFGAAGYFRAKRREGTMTRPSREKEKSNE